MHIYPDLHEIDTKDQRHCEFMFAYAQNNSPLSTCTSPCIQACVQGVYHCPACTAGTRSIGADMYLPREGQHGAKRTARECFLSGSGLLHMARIEALYQNRKRAGVYDMDVRFYEAPRDTELNLSDRDKVRRPYRAVLHLKVTYGYQSHFSCSYIMVHGAFLVLLMSQLLTQLLASIQSTNYISCPWDPSGGSTDNIFNNVVAFSDQQRVGVDCKQCLN